METIAVFNSDIARLVLQYLFNQRLKKASRIFCKTSPYLDRQFDASKYDVRIHSFFPDLEEIICEYVKISHKVQQVVLRQTQNSKLQLNGCKLSEKLVKLLDHLLELCADNTKKLVKADCQIQSEQGNQTKEKYTKRKRQLIDSCDEQKRTNSYVSKQKRKRLQEPLRFINSKSDKEKNAIDFINTSTSDTCSTSSADNSTTTDELEFSKNVDNSILEQPNKQSTPHKKQHNQSTTLRKFQKNSIPSIKEITNTILDNQEFQMKLVTNINSALNNATEKIDNNVNSVETNVETATSSDIRTPNKTVDEVNESLDRKIKSIMEALEKDPVFEEMVEEVVDAANKTNYSDVRYNNKETAASSSSATITTNNTTTSSQAAAVAKQTVLTFNEIGVGTENNNVLENVNNLSLAPQTPLVIRNALTATTNNETNIGFPILAASSSMTQFNDPNYSISKLIFFNSNETNQKQFYPSAGNLTSENLLNDLNTAAVDISTGHLTFPVVMTQDGNIANIPFIINNEFIAQQLQPGNLSNMEGSKIEVAFPESIFAPTDNVALNSVQISNIENSQAVVQYQEVLQQQQKKQEQNEQKERTERQEQNDQQQTPTTSNQNAKQQQEEEKQHTKKKQQAQESTQQSELQLEQSKPKILKKSVQKQGIQLQNITTIKKLKDYTSTATLPTSLNMRINSERITPISNSVVNFKAYKSLSTPRKREPHVRALSFSPKVTINPSAAVQLTTPLSTRRDFVSRLFKHVKTDVPEVPEKAVIKNIEILPRLPTNAVDTNTNDSSNSCSVPPLFAAGEESSNQTVIKSNFSKKNGKLIKTKVAPKKEPKKSSTTATNAKSNEIISTTEENYQNGKKIIIKRLKQQPVKLTKNIDEPKIEEADATKENQQKNTTTPIGAAQSCNVENVDNGDNADMMEEWKRLRSQTASDLDSRLREINSKSNIQNRKRGNKKKVRRRKGTKAKEREKAAAINAAKQDLDDESNNEFTETTSEIIEQNQNNMNNQQQHAQQQEQTRNDNKKEFNIKITKPQKTSSTSSSSLLSSSSSSSSSSSLTKKEKPGNSKLNNTNEIAAILIQSIEKSQQNDTATVASNNLTKALKAPQVLHVNDNYLREKRTGNIACLLETPFKNENTIGGFLPPTPGMFIGALDTPSLKLDPRQEMMHSDSYLFGSISKSFYETPFLNAKTPGYLFSSFSSKEGTPKTITCTDYSSGGSYYKPDETNELETNINKYSNSNNNNNKQQQQIIENQQEMQQNAQLDQNEIFEKVEAEQPVCVEIPAEKLMVEPILLKRIKSFGSENGAATNDIATDAHYTLASGLPDIIVEEADNSSSSSSSYLTSSRSSSSSSSSDTSKSSVGLNEDEKIKKPNVSSISLENLSNISSTEDEDWTNIPENNEENSQLVSENGEVRYPVRSWLTPNKEFKPIAETSPITVNLCLKSVEKRKNNATELQQKRERIKAKLQNDSKQKAAAAPVNTRKIKIDRGRLKKVGLSFPISILPNKQTPRKELFAALNLSAAKHMVTKVKPISSMDKRKQNIAKGTVSTKLPPALGDIDDNAVSHIIEKKKEGHTAISTTRQCLQIEALPVSTGKRGKSKPKTIVRTQLGFKGPASASTELTTVLGNVFTDCATDKVLVNPTSPLKLTQKLLKLKQLAGTGETITTKQQSKPKKVTTTTAVAAVKIKEMKKNKMVVKTVIRPCIRVTRLSAKQETVKETKKVEETAAPTVSKVKKLKITETTTDKLMKKVNDHNALLIEKKSIETVQKTCEIDKNSLLLTTTTPPSIQNKNVNNLSTPIGNEIDIEKIETINSEQKSTPIQSENVDEFHNLKNPSSEQSKRSITPTTDEYFILDDVNYTEDDIIIFQTNDNDALKTKNVINTNKMGNYKMILYINDQKRVLEATNEICLYENLPLEKSVSNTTKTIRNIPKKRQILLSTSSNGEETYITQQQQQPQQSQLQQQIQKSNSQNNTRKMDTTTTTTTSNLMTNQEKINGETAGTVVTNTNCDDTQSQNKLPTKVNKTEAASYTNDNSTEDPAKKLNIGDIDTILSHLHGM